MAAYEEPEWSAPPPAEAETTPFRLEIMKEGVIIGEVPLTGRNYYLLGRQHDIVHIPMDHMSISRIHAVLNFRNDGALMIRDLGSAQGTQLNKQPCDPNTYYRVYVGDLLRFGASTRKYIVSGPVEYERQEYDSENLERKRREAEEKSERIRKQQQKKEEVENSISWGISDDDMMMHHHQEEDRSEEKKKSQLPEYLRNDEHYDRKFGEKFAAEIKDDEAKNSKDQETMEKIRKKERKVQNMQEENRRIFMKENNQDGGLTEGQQKAVERNDKAIEQLKADIDSLVKQIRSKNLQRELKGTEIQSGTGKKRSAREVLQEDEDVLDTSMEYTTADASTNWRMRRKMMKSRDGTTAAAAAAKAALGDGPAHALTYSEITMKLDSASIALTEIRKQLSKVQGSLSSKIEFENKSGTKLEDIDQLMLKEELADLQKQQLRLQEDERQLNEQINGLQQLQKVAAPALLSLALEKKTHEQIHETASITQKSKDVLNDHRSKSITGDAPSKLIKAAGTIIEQELVEQKMKPSKGKHEDNICAKEGSPQNDEVELTATEKLRMLQKDIEAEKEKIQKDLKSDMTTTTYARTYSASIATRNEHESAASAATDPKSQAIDKPTKRTRNAVRNISYDPKQLQDGDFVWVPPNNQKGDGKTSLNEKLGY